MKRKPSISHDEAMAKELRENPEFAVEYFRAALEEGDDPQILLIALRRIAESRGGVAEVRERGWYRTGEPLPCAVGQRESTTLYAGCCNQGGGAAPYR